MYLLFVVLSMGGVFSISPVLIRSLNTTTSLYYEPLREVYLFQSARKIVTYIDLRSLKPPGFSTPPLGDLKEKCRTILNDRCSTLIDSPNILYKTKLINKQIKSLQELNNKYFMYLGKKLISSTKLAKDQTVTHMTENDARYFNDQIMTMLKSGNMTLEIPLDKTHIVKPEIRYT